MLQLRLSSCQHGELLNYKPDYTQPPPYTPSFREHLLSRQLHSINFTRCSENPAASWGKNKTNDNFTTHTHIVECRKEKEGEVERG